MSLPRLLGRRCHRRTRQRARRTMRVTATSAAILTAAGVLVVVPALSGAQASTAPVGSPTGVAEHIISAPGGVEFSGWALDPDATVPAGSTVTAPVTVYLTVDGKKVTTKGASTVANLPRPDLARTTPAANGHGFDSKLLVPAGKHTFCVWATNIAKTPGVSTELRCMTATMNYSPSSKVQAFSASNGALHLAGWAYDPDAPTTPLAVLVTVDRKTTTLTADLKNAGVAVAHPRGGNLHGFAVNLPATQGSHSVCISVRNIGYGSDTPNIRCGTLTLSESPVAGLDTLARSGSEVHVRGWAYDPDAPTTALKIQLTVDGRISTLTANGIRTDVAKAHPSAGSHHGFDTYLKLAEGPHRVCVTALNISYGSNRALACTETDLYFTPTAAITALTATPTGLTVTGWTSDPDTTKAISARIAVNGTTKSTVTANRAATTHSGHAFTATYVLKSGVQQVCVTGLNVVYGTHNSPAACRSITLALAPLGSFDTLTRAAPTATSAPITVTGWAFDPDTTASTSVVVTVGGASAGTFATTVRRTDVTAKYPSAGSAAHGFSITVPTSAALQTVCVTAVNVGGGTNHSLGCKVVFAVHPVAPSAVQTVKAVPTYGAATISWTAPASNGGATIAYYTVTSGTTTAKVTGTSYTETKLAQTTKYTFTVKAVNGVGLVSPGVAVSATTPTGPPPQTTPAPVSTSRYIRNVRGATSADLAAMRREGAADAAANPSGHKYLVLLDIGGQDHYDQGVVLSAGVRFVSYANLVSDLKAYVDGYHSAQRSTAPVTIALGTNNDMDVSATTGAEWADKIVDPVRSYAAKYSNISVAGANDIEPGFRATYTQTKSWLSGYLSATSAAFVFNGSADGCAWTTTDHSCNNGWTMKGLYYLAEGASPSRMITLPQVYNTTMAAQWKYISLTGIKYGQPRITFGGPLTEYTACVQARSCGSLTGRTAWSQMWNNLQSDPRLKVTTLPYSTDLRIDS